MTRAVLLAMLDTMFPGDHGKPPLPPASQAGLDLAKLERLAKPVVAALGDADAFSTAAPAERVATLRIVELNAPTAFKAFLVESLASYYECPPVLAALGWRVAPPQPHGHALPPNNGESFHALDKVKSRGQLWRA